MLLVWNALLGLLWPLMYFYRPFRGTVPQRLGRDLPDWSSQGPAPAPARGGADEDGRAQGPAPSKMILINAVSAGEVAAAAPVIRELRQRLPDCRIALLTTTDSGQEMARVRLAGLLDWQGYFPLLDLPWVARCYLDRLRPDVYITTESELWPNIMGQCHRRGIPVVSLNARVYLHNKRGWRLRLAQYLYNLVDLIICQTAEQRANFVQLGVPEFKLAISGNVKFDIDVPQWSAAQLSDWRKQVGLDGYDGAVVVAGSTHEGEEQLFLDALGLLPADLQPLLIFAPRHIGRAEEVAKLATELGWTARLLSTPSPKTGDFGRRNAIVADRYGILVDLYRLAEVVVMGGTFHPKVGGHNLLEATALGKPVIAGPHVYSIAAQVELLEAAGGLVRCDESSQALAAALQRLLMDAGQAQQVGEAALIATEANRGAAVRAAQLVAQQIGD